MPDGITVSNAIEAEEHFALYGNAYGCHAPTEMEFNQRIVAEPLDKA